MPEAAETAPPSPGSHGKTPRLLEPRALTILSLVFVAVWAAVHAVAMAGLERGHAWIGASPLWPLTVFAATPAGVTRPSWMIGLAAIALATFLAIVPRLVRRADRLALVFACGFVAALASNALQGIEHGFAHPVAAMDWGGVQYHHDALEIRSVRAFLHDYVARQPSLRLHSRTHPPGAVLLYLPSIRLGIPPAATAVAFCAFTFAVLALATSGLARARGGRRGSGIATLLLLLSPALQIYGCSTMDAVFAALVWATIAGIVRGTRASVFVAALALAGASFLSFLAPFAIGVAMLVECVALRRLPARSLAVLAFTVVVHAVLFGLTGFEWVESLRVATRLENPAGPLFLVDPQRYLGSRLQDVAEFALFAGPVLLAFTVAGYARPRPTRAPAFVASWASALMLGGVLALGAFSRAETARIWQFALPALVLPAARVVERLDDAAVEHALVLVYAQSITMQLVGDFFW